MTFRTSAITDFIIHHSAGPITQTISDIDAEHRSIGDAMIGYNWVIDHDGVVWEARDPIYTPAAAYGRNEQSVNVCLIGQFHPNAPGFTGDPTVSQLAALANLCVYAHHRWPGIIRTIPHSDVAGFYPESERGNYSTECPGDRLRAHIPQIRSYVYSKVNAR
jgi:hypothetical protein